jgi:hypothetical protein
MAPSDHENVDSGSLGPEVASFWVSLKRWLMTLSFCVFCRDVVGLNHNENHIQSLVLMRDE